MANSNSSSNQPEENTCCRNDVVDTAQKARNSTVSRWIFVH